MATTKRSRGSAAAAAPPVPRKQSAKAASASAKEWKPNPLMAAYRNHQIDVPAALVAVTLAATYLAPGSPFAHLALPSHPVSVPAGAPRPTGVAFAGPTDTLYGKGPYDLAFIAFGVVVWTLLRAVVIDYVLRPTARYLGCKRSMLDRFGEQGWLVVYYTLSWSVGMFFVVNSAFWSDTRHFWTDYPHLYLSAAFKSYYLMQLAFWIQQLFVIHIEKPRKDYTQMLVHHLVTCALIISSYYANFTRIGSAVLVAMDVGDIFLCSAKCFNYVRWRRLCDATFVVFVAVWLYSRHYVYLGIMYSVYAESRAVLDWTWNPAAGSFVSDGMWYFFLILLGALQVLLVMWLYLIVRVIAKVIRGNSAEDNRSDDEDSDEDEPAPPKKKHE
ncbi:Sphingosine N-acyltransferase lag1 [Blastocladiella emersonii ATCC 22665]|nr:Sphingosine N-acyltransferase lag1 [Blastocladiella emersonii ATCC 22665]